MPILKRWHLLRTDTLYECQVIVLTLIFIAGFPLYIP